MTDSTTPVPTEDQRISDEKRARLVKADFAVPALRVLRVSDKSKTAADVSQASTSNGYLATKSALHRRLLNELEAKNLLDSDENAIAGFISDFTKGVLSTEELPLNHYERRILADDLIQETLGVGPLAPLMKDPAVSDILVNDPKNIFVERYGRLEKTSISFKDEAHLIRIIQRLVARVGRRIDESSPLVDARLADGSRINATLPPISVNGPTLSIRRFAKIHYTLEKLQELEMFSPAMTEFLAAAVKARLNILVSGGGGAGKSTFISALAALIPPGERLITIEDAVELQLSHENIVRMETRTNNTEGAGVITTRDLVINSLRMRPDRIIVGEVRGAEALDMLQAMNTGHEGSMTTVHANSPKDALTRLETMVLLAGTELPSRAIREQINSAIHLVVHIRRHEDGKRRISTICEIERLDDTQFHVRELFKFNYIGNEDGRVIGEFETSGFTPRCFELLQLHTPKLPEALFKSNPQADR
ncbi:MAG: CpaF family protein [Sumerlaeia bacterium]